MALMNHGWRNLAAMVLAICLVALVLHPASAGAALLAVLVLAPVTLFGLILVPRSLWPPLQLETVFAAPVLRRAALFQRPPPVSL